MVRVHLIADENEMCSLSLSRGKDEQMHCETCYIQSISASCYFYFFAFIFLFLVFILFSVHFFSSCVHANGQNASLQRSWILPVNSTCNSQLNMSAFLILTLFYPMWKVHVARIPFVLNTFCSTSFVLFPFYFYYIRLHATSIQTSYIVALPKAHFQCVSVWLNFLWMNTFNFFMDFLFLLDTLKRTASTWIVWCKGLKLSNVYNFEAKHVKHLNAILIPKVGWALCIRDMSTTFLACIDWWLIEMLALFA